MDFFLRKATKADADILFEWVNDKTTRASAFNTEPIMYENHVKWYSGILDDENVLQYILMSDNTPVGQIRLNVNGNMAVLDYNVAPKYRGQGFGIIIIDLIIKEVKKSELDIDRLVAQVKPENYASMSCLEKNGFVKKYLQYEYNL